MHRVGDLPQGVRLLLSPLAGGLELRLAFSLGLRLGVTQNPGRFLLGGFDLPFRFLAGRFDLRVQRRFAAGQFT